MIWTFLDKYRNLGLLLFRVGFGLYMAIGHGFGKITAGPALWGKLGGTMEMFGLGFAPTFWGFMAAFAEFVGALLVAVGLLTRPAALLLVVNMFVAAMTHITGEGSPEMAILYGVFFLGLVLTGPGKYSLDEQL